MKISILITLLLFSFSALTADGFRTKDTGKDAVILANIIASKKTPESVKSLLSTIVTGQTFEKRVSLISTEHDGALGGLVISLKIGIDDTTDWHSGWSEVIEVQAEYLRNEEGNFYHLQKVSSKKL